MSIENDVFLNAIEISDPDERLRYVAEACRNDEALRKRVLALLEADSEASRISLSSAMKDVQAGVKALRNMGTEKQVDVMGSDDTDETIIDHDSAAKADAERVLADFKAHLDSSSREGWLGRLTHYEIEEILGHGAFGIVAKAFDEKLHRVVAIKMMRPELATTSPPRKRFLREARAAAAVSHENIVGVYAVEETPIPYLVMEFISGPTLRQRMNATGPLEPDDVIKISLQVARGLAAAHQANLIHRDIKPGNILLTNDPQERVKISDFGLARAVDDASLTQSGVVAGTPLYMAPEQAKGETLDHRADLFSLGSVMYQMLTGHPPFRAPNTMAVLKRVCEDTPRPLKDVIPETPQWMSDIVFRLLEKGREDRFQSAQEVVEVLESHQKQLAAGIPPQTNVSAETQVKARRWKYPAVAAISLTLLASIAFFATHTDHPPSGPAEVGTSSNVSEEPLGNLPEPEKNSRLLVGDGFYLVSADVSGNYRIAFSARGKRDNSGQLLVVVPIGASNVHVLFGAYRKYGGPLNGFGRLKDLMMPGDLFADGLCHTVEIDTTATSVVVKVDGNLIAKWNGNAKDIHEKWPAREAERPIAFQGLPGSDWRISDLVVMPTDSGITAFQARQTSDKAILQQVERMGGRVNLNVGPFDWPPDRRDLKPGEFVSLYGREMDIFFEKGAVSDESLRRLCSQLRNRSDVHLRCVHLGRCPVTNDGLLSLKGIPIEQLSVKQTKVNGDELANNIEDYRVTDWCTVPRLSNRGLRTFLESETVKSIDLTIDQLTSDVVHAINNSCLDKLVLRGPGKNGWPAPEFLKPLEYLSILILQLEEPMSEEELRRMHRQIPGVELSQGETVIPPTAEGILSQLKNCRNGRTVPGGSTATIATSLKQPFQLTFQAQRLGNDNSVVVSIPFGNRSAGIIFAGWPELGTFSGLALVDGVNVPDSPEKVSGDLFADGNTHKVIVRVISDRIQATVDDHTIVDWTGTPDQLSPYRGKHDVDADLFLQMYSDFRISDLELELLKPASAGDSQSRN